ncbi:HugZ family protein [Brevibacillus sp. DP1.3A]|uniref:HugZ family pyridoxamine 5'-phosphate oxidase n=1 Tax=Brevibacillus sp. DP1.3A TaxID=2738867 RepID=UPI00156AF210|nr:pyridoxamine 5'-phosphate oxidase family protein [Brevibacillus sp. DP1.3A]UED73836.1 pyridoxamine 5'-phosphate oxidase family protein [Brevibacillus sp. DP1.3A]
MKAMDKEAMKTQYQSFAADMKTLMLSTVDEHGKPFLSYAPFVKYDGKFYIYISKIANHYRYMEENPAVDAMLIEDESKATNLFARQRARFVCSALNLGNAGYDEIFELFAQSFGKNMMDMLRGLDFSLFELTPSEGRYVAGFGQAYDIDLTADKFVHVNRDGHTSKK